MAIDVLSTKRIVSFAALFVLARLPRGSRSWIDYERGKRLLVDLPPDEYERGLIELTEYLCL
ncbi:MAG: hypothetical protein M0Z38_06845 [Deltaproteobacteria bacterium]|nr:hypothetical protein [Deltaproteobacteria bacterium]